MIDKLNDDKFVDWLWMNYQRHINKVELQNKLQNLIKSVENKTWIPGPQKEMAAIINGKVKISYIKDSPSRQFTLIMKQIRDIEREERGGFILKFGNANIQQ